MQYSIVQCSALQCSALQSRYCPVQCGALIVHVVLFSVSQCSVVVECHAVRTLSQCSVAQCSTVLCSAIKCDAVQCSVVWCNHNGAVLFGVSEVFTFLIPSILPFSAASRPLIQLLCTCVCVYVCGAGVCYRPYAAQRFGEIAFCAISGAEQVKGYGTLLLNHLKTHVQKDSKLCDAMRCDAM